MMNQEFFEVNLFHICYDSHEWYHKWFYSQFKKDVAKIPLQMINDKNYSETGYRFGTNVTAFYINIKE